MTTLMTAFDGVQVPTRQDPANFPARGDDMMSRFPPFQAQINTITGEVNANTLSAAASAAQALASSNAAIAVSNTVQWVSGTVYQGGSVQWSPLTKLSYRRGSTGSGTTDPSQDPANYTLVTPVSAFGGAAATGNQTLTKDSSGAQNLAPTGYGQAVTLPDATTCTRSALVFSVKNTGNYPYGIKDASGAYLGWVPPKQTVLVGLADNASSAGAWQLYGADPAAITAVSTLSLDLAIFDVVAVDANRTFLLLASSNSIYGMVLDSSTGQFGAPTLIRAPGSAVNFAYAVATATAGQVLVATCNSTTALEVVALTLTGTSIAVGTPATATLAGNGGQAGGGFVALGTNYLLMYGRPGFIGLRNVTVSGTTPSISAETPMTGATAPVSLFAVNATTAMSFGYNGTNHYATPVTISAGLPALGTQTSWANTNNLEAVRAWGSRWLTFSAGNMGLVSLAGTVASNTTFAGNLTAGDATSGYLADGQISATKWFYALANSLTVSIVTDAAGTASRATAAFLGAPTGANGFSGMALGKLTSTRAFLYMEEAGTSIEGSINAYRNYKMVEVDVSGATPAIVKTSLFDSPHTYNGSASDINLKNNGTLPLPPYSYRGLVPSLAGTPTRDVSQGVQKLPGSPHAFGVDATVGIIANGPTSLVFDGAGASPRHIPSLNMAPGRVNTASSIWKVLNGMHINSRRVVGQCGALTNLRTFFTMECAA